MKNIRGLKQNMFLRKGYLNKRTNLFQLSNKRFIIGIVLFILYSSIFYFLLKLFREFLRIIRGLLYRNQILLLSNEERFFYNYFFAFIASIFALAMVFSYWFENPRKPFERYSYIRSNIAHNQRYTAWYYMHWFIKIALTFGLLFIDSYTYSMYPEYCYVFVLFALVFFLQSWTAYREYIRNKALKWILISFISINVFSGILSTLELVNFDKLDQILLERNMRYKYKIEVPTSKVYSSFYKYSNSLELNLLSGDEEVEIVVLGYNSDVEFPLSYLKSFLKNDFYFAEYIPRLNFILTVDKDFKMKDIYRVKQAILSLGAKHISYSVRPENTNANIPFYNYSGNIFPNHLFFTNDKSVQNTLLIKYYNNQKIFIEDKELSISNMKAIVKHRLQEDLDYLFRITIDDAMTLDNYIQILEKLQLAVDELKNEYSIKHFEISYQDLIESARMDYNVEVSNDIKEINNKYTLNIVDVR